jgi:hypothetical protein
MTERNDTLRALGRVKKEADTAPLFYTEEGRNRTQFFVWILAGIIALVGSVISFTVLIVGYKNDIVANKTALVQLRADVDAARETAKEVKDEYDRKKPDIEKAMTKIAELSAFDFKKINELTIDMATQREYGINNEAWYRGKHGGAPPPARPN